MRKLFLVLTLVTVGLYGGVLAQSLTRDTGVQALSETEIARPCSGNRAATSKATGVTYFCRQGAWTPELSTSCSPDPPVGACVSNSTCLATSGSVPVTYVCLNGAWAESTTATAALQGTDTVAINPDTNSDESGKVTLWPRSTSEGRSLLQLGDDTSPNYNQYPWPQIDFWNPRATTIGGERRITSYSGPSFSFVMDLPDYSENAADVPGNSAGIEAEYEGAWPCGDAASCLRLQSRRTRQAGTYSGVTLENYGDRDVNEAGYYATTPKSTVGLFAVNNYGTQTKFSVRLQGDYNNDGTIDRSDFGDPSGVYSGGHSYNGSCTDVAGCYTGDDMTHTIWQSMGLVPMFDSSFDDTSDCPAGSSRADNTCPEPGNDHWAHFNVVFKDIAPRAGVTRNGIPSYDPQQYTQFMLYPDPVACEQYANDTDGGSILALQSDDYRAAYNTAPFGSTYRKMCFASLLSEDMPGKPNQPWTFGGSIDINGDASVTFKSKDDTIFRPYPIQDQKNIRIAARRLQIEGPLELGATGGYFIGDTPATTTSQPAYIGTGVTDTNADGTVDSGRAMQQYFEDVPWGDVLDYTAVGRVVTTVRYQSDLPVLNDGELAAATTYALTATAWYDQDADSTKDSWENGAIVNDVGKLVQNKLAAEGAIRQYADASHPLQTFARVSGADVVWVADLDGDGTEGPGDIALGRTSGIVRSGLTGTTEGFSLAYDGDFLTAPDISTRVPSTNGATYLNASRLFLGSTGSTGGELEGLVIDPFDYTVGIYPASTRAFLGASADVDEGGYGNPDTIHRFEAGFFRYLDLDGGTRIPLEASLLGGSTPALVVGTSGSRGGTGAVCLIDTGLDADCDGTLDKEVRSMYWGAGAMSTDGTDCSAPSEVSISSGPKFYIIACAMGSAETDGFIHGSTVLPDGIDIASDATFEVTARIVTDNAGATAQGYIEIQCVAADATVGSSWSGGANLDITQAAADVADDLLQDTSATVDLATCSAGATLFWRFKICDTDATPSTGCTSSAGAENDHQIVGMKMEYTVATGD